MSGIEVAGLAIGIVPIVVEILKSYSIAKDRLKTFARYTQVALEVQLRYRIAAGNFSNDCQLLLKAAVKDAHELSDMVQNPKHTGWQDHSLEDTFRQFLDRDYQLLEEIVVKIRDVLRDTKRRLTELDDSLPDPGQADEKRASIKQLYQAFNVSLKENKYRRWLDELDQWNKKLSHLRAQRCKLQKQRNCRPDCLIRKSMPKCYGDIRTASQKLHESLKNSWSCTNVSHVGHQAKLSLDAKAEYGTARLDMVIACRRRVSNEDQTTPSEAPIWLHVRSVTTNYSPAPMQSKPHFLLNDMASLVHPLRISNSQPSTSSTAQKAKKSVKRVRFDEPQSVDENPDSHSKKPTVETKMASEDAALAFTMFNLKTTPSFCCHLSKACQSTICRDATLGYLEYPEVPHPFKFIFYDAGRNADAQVTSKIPRKESCSVKALFQNFEVLHQLTLAHKLAMATLQYHSTSWLRQDWGLEDISYFSDTENHEATANKKGLPITEDDLSRSLQSLHLSTQFPAERFTVQPQSSYDAEQLKYIYGIRNLTLAKLGVALLEIGLKKEITSFNVDTMTLALPRVVNARRLLLKDLPSLAMLGKRYIGIVQKCIDCDFSCGDDLGDETLKNAVYSDVVCVLEEMIADWKRFLGIK